MNSSRISAKRADGPSLEVEIFDDDWNSLPHDGEAVGQLLIRGPWIASAYYNDPQPEKFHDGWLVTGDVAGSTRAVRHHHGSCQRPDQIRRRMDFIGGHGKPHCGLADDTNGAVVAAPHPKWDERPVAVVVRLKAPTPL